MTLGVRLGGLAGEAQRIAHEVRHVLHFGPLVVVGDDHGVPFPGEGADPGLQRRDLRGCFGGRFDDRELERHQAGSVVLARGG